MSEKPLYMLVIDPVSQKDLVMPKLDDTDDVKIVADKSTMVPIQFISYTKHQPIICDGIDPICVIASAIEIIYEENIDVSIITANKALIAAFGTSKNIQVHGYELSLFDGVKKNLPKPRSNKAKSAIKSTEKPTENPESNALDANIGKENADKENAGAKADKENVVADSHENHEQSPEKAPTPSGPARPHAPVVSEKAKTEITKLLKSAVKIPMPNDRAWSEMTRGVIAATDDAKGLDFQMKLNMAIMGFNPDMCVKIADQIRPVFSEIQKLKI